MRPGATLGAYGLALAAALGGGALAGTAAGPIDVGDDAVHTNQEDEDMSTDTALPAGGLLVSQAGYQLTPETRTVGNGEFAFTIADDDGRPVTDFVEQHERKLHLIVADRGLTVFHHVHPVMDAQGRWTVDLPVLRPGSYRAFAAFMPAGGDDLTLGIDVTAPGDTPTPTELVPTARDEVDGYDVTLDGHVSAGSAATVTVIVRRDGEVVTTEPYLGAGGHLVALRDGDLAFLHVHPLDEDPDGPVRFAVEVPSAGTYALFFDFLHDGDVRTARFVVEADTTTTPDTDSPAHGDGH